MEKKKGIKNSSNCHTCKNYDVRGFCRSQIIGHHEGGGFCAGYLKTEQNNKNGVYFARFSQK